MGVMIVGTEERGPLDEATRGAVDVARQGVTGAVTTSVGLGLLIFQHAQVQRRELMRHSARILRLLGDTIEERLGPDRR